MFSQIFSFLIHRIWLRKMLADTKYCPQPKGIERNADGTKKDEIERIDLPRKVEKTQDRKWKTIKIGRGWGKE